MNFNKEEFVRKIITTTRNLSFTGFVVLLLAPITGWTIFYIVLPMTFALCVATYLMKKRYLADTLLGRPDFIPRNGEYYLVVESFKPGSYLECEPSIFRIQDIEKHGEGKDGTPKFVKKQIFRLIMIDEKSKDIVIFRSALEHRKIIYFNKGKNDDEPVEMIQNFCIR